MCYWAAIPIAMALVNSVSQGVNNVQNVKAQNAQLDYQARVNENNAKMAEQNAAFARAQAVRNATEKRKETAVLIGKQRARMGASGAVVGTGSFLDTILSTREEGEKDAMSLMQQGDLESWKHLNQANQYYHQAGLSRASKADTRSAVIGSVLSGVANVGMSVFAASGFMGGAGSAAGGAAGGLGETTLINSNATDTLRSVFVGG